MIIFSNNNYTYRLVYNCKSWQIFQFPCQVASLIDFKLNIFAHTILCFSFNMTAILWCPCMKLSLVYVIPRKHLLQNLQHYIVCACSSNFFLYVIRSSMRCFSKIAEKKSMKATLGKTLCKRRQVALPNNKVFASR